MATGDAKLFVARGGAMGATAMTTLVSGGLGIDSVTVEDPGVAGTLGPTEEQMTHMVIKPTAVFSDYMEALALIGQTAANFVLKYKGPANANRKMTIKNVVWTKPPTQIMVPAKDGGGKISLFAIQGNANWGSSDTLALMIVDAADA